MARSKKHIIKLTDDEVRELKFVIRKKKTSKTICSRCQIILDLDEAHGNLSFLWKQGYDSSGWSISVPPLSVSAFRCTIKRKLTSHSSGV